MPVYKRGKTYWYHFEFNGEHVQQSTKQGNKNVARQMEAAHRTALAKGEVGIITKKPVPRLVDHAKRFMDAIQVRCAAEPKTVEFYAQQLKRLLDFEPLANSRLDKISEGLIESFVQHRIQQEVSVRGVSPGDISHPCQGVIRGLGGPLIRKGRYHRFGPVQAKLFKKKSEALDQEAPGLAPGRVTCAEHVRQLGSESLLPT